MELWVKKPLAASGEENSNKLPGWSYRRQISVFNPGPTQTDYQVLVNLDTAGLMGYTVYELPVSISSNGTSLTDYQVNVTITDANILNHITSDGRDIRFFNQSANSPYTDTDGKLDFWIESISSSKLTAWIKTDVPASGGKTVYMYYGNPSATYAGATYGIDSYTVLMLHMNGADGSTTFTDSSSGVKSVTANGNAQIDTAQSKFGGASGLFDGSGDYLSLADSDDWYFGTGDFTIDLWVRFNDLTNAAVFAGQYGSSNRYWYVHKDTDANGNKLRIYAYYYVSVINRQTFHYVMTNNWSPSVNTWYHIAFVKTGSVAKIFIDGVEQTLTAVSTQSAFSFNYAGDLVIGSQNSGSYLNGWLDEFRVSKGAARWTSDFTPPSGEYVNYTSGGPTVSFGTETVKQTTRKMNSDCGDVRFTDSDETTQLNYWLESDCNSNSTKLWVKVPSIPFGTKTIYIYYGNPSATSASNGTATFDFFDDFSGTSLDTNKWNTPYTVDSGTSASVNNGMLDFNVLSGYAHTGGCVISKTALPSANYVVETKVKFTDFWISALGAYSGFTNQTTYESTYYGSPAYLMSTHLYDYPSYNYYLSLLAHSIGWATGSTPLTIRNLWFRMQLFYTPDIYAKGVWTQLESPYVQQTLQMSGSGGLSPTYVTLGIGDYNTNEHTYFDFVLVRKYSSPEPYTQEISKVKECTDPNPNLQCILNYDDCSYQGTYQGNAITYEDSTFLSESGWNNLYTCEGPKRCNNNGVREVGEPCDCGGGTCSPQQLNYRNCTNFDEYTGGTLGCRSDCEYSFTACIPYSCNNNGIRETGEACDCGGGSCSSQQLNHMSCTDFDEFTSGTLNCDNTCHYDTTKCKAPSIYVPFFVGGTFNITGYIEYLNVFWDATYRTNPRQLAVNCTFYGLTVQNCTPNPYIQPPGKGSCTVVNPAYNYSKPNEIVCRVYDPNDLTLGYNEY